MKSSRYVAIAVVFVVLILRAQVFYTDLIGDENAFLFRTSLYLVASASAEFFADIALSPMEAAKVKIQTTPGYANTLRVAMPKMYAEEGVYSFYKSLVPLWMRQIPYTMMKFALLRANGRTVVQVRGAEATIRVFQIRTISRDVRRRLHRRCILCYRESSS
jgi:hypothetical protein